MNSKILCVDFLNFVHRSRGGFALGDYPIVFNFVRNFRSLVEQFEPSRIYVVRDGSSKQRTSTYAEYKANRKPLSDDFLRQERLIRELLDNLPVSTMVHPEHEADDLIYNLVKNASIAVPWTVVSTDSDFVQLLCEFSNVDVYDPVKKEFFQRPAYDYLLWKSLRGDPSDNIKGVAGVSDSKAEVLASCPSDLSSFFESDSSKRETFLRNVDLIKFKSFSEEELYKVESSVVQRDWNAIEGKFRDFGFKSLLKENTWKRFCDTFDPLFG